jgi:copper transport protein
VTRRWRAAAAAGAALVLLAAPGVAAAHPRLLGATPPSDSVRTSAPTEVRLRFDERVQPVAGGIDVRDPAGRHVAVGPLRRNGDTVARAISATRQGTYLVEWLVVGTDSHPARGVYLFSVGRSTRAGVGTDTALGDALQATGRWVSLAGFVLGFGLPFAVALAGQAMTRRSWTLVGFGVAAMIVAEVFALLGQTATLQPSDPFRPRIAGDVLLTSYGRVAGLRLGGALALWALAGAVRQSRSPRAIWTIPLVGAALALVHADAAHRIAGLPVVLSVVVVAAHIAAAGAWLGLLVFALMTREGVPRRLVAAVAGATAVLVASGIGLAIGHLTAVGDLVATGYGEALTVKLGVLALALWLGTVGRRRAELAVAAAALAAAATLVSLLPPS